MPDVEQQTKIMIIPRQGKGRSHRTQMEYKKRNNDAASSTSPARPITLQQDDCTFFSTVNGITVIVVYKLVWLQFPYMNGAKGKGNGDIIKRRISFSFPNKQTSEKELKLKTKKEEVGYQSK